MCQSRRLIWIRKFGATMPGSLSGFKKKILFSNADGPVCYDSPDRWDNLPEAASNLPGVFPSLLTFSAGPRVRPMIDHISH